MTTELDAAIRAQANRPTSAAGMAGPDDLALIAALAQGNNQALEMLYDRYAAVVYRLALRMLQSPEMAEDLVQEVFWRVWRRASSFERERGRVAQWLFGIAHNLCVDELRRLRARPTPVYEDADNPLIQRLADERIDIPATAWAAEQRRAIAQALYELPAPQRQARLGPFEHEPIDSRLRRVRDDSHATHDRIEACGVATVPAPQRDVTQAYRGHRVHGNVHQDAHRAVAGRLARL